MLEWTQMLRKTATVNKITAFTITLLVLVATTACGKAVSAQTTQGIALSPPVFELTGNPGDTLNNTIRVDNLTDADLGIELDKKNFTAKGDEGAVWLSDEENSFSLATWIEESKDVAPITAKTSRLIGFRINIPQNAEPGGYYGAIIFRTKAPQGMKATGATLSQEVAALVLLRVAGSVNETASISTFTSTKKLFEYGPVGFEAQVKNDSTVHIKPTGGITITNFFGQKVATVEITQKNILPSATRNLYGTWDQPWAIGKFTATISMVYGDNNQMLTSSTSFFMFPYRAAGAILLVLSLFGAVIYKGRRRLAKMAKVLFAKDAE